MNTEPKPRTSTLRRIGIGIAVLLIVAAAVAAFLLLRAPPPVDATSVDFDAALRGVKFDPSQDHNGAQGENGIPEGFEMALLAAILKNPALDLSARGGVSHDAVQKAYLQANASARADTKALSLLWPTTPDVIAGYSLLGKDSHAAIKSMTAGFGAPLQSDYSLALDLDRYLSAEGDADGDGFTDRQEYYATREQGRDAYVRAALDPDLHPTPEQLANLPKPQKTRFTVGVVLYPGFEVLDVYGPVEMWSNTPGFEVVFIAQTAGPVRSAQGAQTVATHSFESAPKLDILMVPGGFGTQTELQNRPLLDYLVRADKDTQFTTSVCTGSALLAKAGLLDGHRATSNKRFFSLAEAQSQAVTWVPDARWVESGKMFTSSGVSAGTDMALGLIAKMKGKMVAAEIASALEYVWHDQADQDPFANYVRRLEAPEAGADAGPDRLVKSMPEAGARLAESPQWLRLFFSKRPLIETRQLRLSPVGQPTLQIPLSTFHEMGEKDLMFKVDQPLAAGDYLLSWTVTLDGSTQPLSGQVAFCVGGQGSPE